MTLQDLKTNREEIITFIKSMEYDMKFAMEMAVEICGGCDSLDELKDELRNYCRPVKSSKLAEMVCANELENGVKYDVVKKEYIKI